MVTRAFLAAILAIAAILTALSIADAQSSTVALTVNSRYADGAPLSGMWTVLRSGGPSGPVAATGFSPVTFTVNPGAQYTVSAGNYQQIAFHHWLDNSATLAVRTFSVNSATIFTALYTSPYHPLPSGIPPSQGTAATINVSSATQGGSPVSGVYTVIHNNTPTGPVLVAANTPLSYSGAKTGQTYSVSPSPYEIFASGSYTFVQWQDSPSAPRVRSVTLTSIVTSLVAVYKHNPAGLDSMTVKSADMHGNALSGMLVKITPAPRGNIAPQYTPAAWTLEGSTPYIFSTQDYGNYVFSHWQDGNATRNRTVLPAPGAALTAYYRVVPTSGTDSAAPAVSIAAPLTGRVVESYAATISGTASDANGVLSVNISIDNGPFQPADGLARWSYLTQPLENDKSHTVAVKAVDGRGNAATATTSFTTAVHPLLNKTGLYIPMYILPSTPQAVAFYNTVASEKIAHPSVPIVAAINPASGPGTSQNPDFVAAIDNLDAAGVTVIGYTPTKYGARDINAVKADIDRYVNWYSVSGIMLDEFANYAGYESYYTELTAYAKGKGLQIVIGNAGADPPQSYLGTVDVIGITEGDGYPPKQWLQHCVRCSVTATNGWHYAHDKDNFRFSRYAIDTLDPEFVREASKWVGLFYLTDGVSPARWTHIPPYFEDLVEALDR